MLCTCVLCILLKVHNNEPLTLHDGTLWKPKGAAKVATNPAPKQGRFKRREKAIAKRKAALAAEQVEEETAPSKDNRAPPRKQAKRVQTAASDLFDRLKAQRRGEQHADHDDY